MAYLPLPDLAPFAAPQRSTALALRRWRFEARTFRSKGRNTPFDGWEMTGRAVAVRVGGRLVYDDRPGTAAALRSAAS